jgi:hypothetical protein
MDWQRLYHDAGPSRLPPPGPSLAPTLPSLPQFQFLHPRQNQWHARRRFASASPLTLCSCRSFQFQIPTDQLLAFCSTERRDSFYGNLGAAQEAARAGVISQTATSNDEHWNRWTEFCSDLVVDPFLSGVVDPVHLLQVFANKYRTGEIAPRGKPVKSRTVEGALRAVGQTFTSLGSLDPRLTASGHHDFRLKRQLNGYKRQDSPPKRVKPIPLIVLLNVMGLASTANTIEGLAIADMIAIAFFLLLRPGEYTAPKQDNSPFRLQDVLLTVGPNRYTGSTLPLHLIPAVTFGTFTVTNQKNGIRGHSFGLARSGNPSLCFLGSTLRRIRHLRENNAPPDTPLCTYYIEGVPRFVTANNITTTLRFSVTALGPNLGFTAKEVSARSLRSAGAMALLCAGVDTSKIKLLGRWLSDEMFKYLTVQAQPIMHNFARLMVAGANYSLNPSA